MVDDAGADGIMNSLSSTSIKVISELSEKYNVQHSCLVNYTNPVASSIKPFKYEDWNFDEIINHISYLIYKGMDVSEFTGLLTEETANAIMEGIKPIYNVGGILTEVDIDFELRRNMKKNIFVFSHCKSYNQLRSINELLRNDKLKLRFNDFKKEVVKLGEVFNDNFLRTEYNYSIGTAQEIKKWNNYTEGNPDQLLMYSTVGDGRVRPEHALLNGIIKPASDDFWRQYGPLNGYNCRCTKIRVDNDSKVTDIDYTQLQQVKIDDEFKFNPALENQLFYIKKHSYYKSIPNRDKKRIVEEAEILFNKN